MALLHSTFTHLGAAGALPKLLGDSPSRPLLGTCGRLVAVGSSLSNISFYDSDNVAELESALGTGSCKFKLLGNLDLLDAGNPLALKELHFLHGGSLAVVGQSTGANSAAGTQVGGTVIHVYDLVISATAPLVPSIASSSPYLDPPGAGQAKQGATFNTALGRLHAPDIEIAVLPRLTYRSYLPGVKWARIIPHPTVAHAFGVILPNDSVVRFYTSAEGGSGSSSFLGEIACIEPVTHGIFSRDGSLFAAADVERQILVFACGVDRRRPSTHIDDDDAENEPQAKGIATKGKKQKSSIRAKAAAPHSLATADPAVFTNGGIFPCECVARFQCESPVTALSFAVIPAPKDCALFERFLYNCALLVSGHANGFLNVWWLGNRHYASAASPSTLNPPAEVTAPRRVPPPRVMTWGGPVATDPPSIPVQTEPIGSYPPFHASRGAISFITAGVTADEGRYGQEPHPSLFSTQGGQENSKEGAYPTTVTLLCVGAEGAKGFRVYTFEHTAALPASASASPISILASSSIGLVEAESHSTAPDYVPGHYAWDHKGRRSYVPPAVRSVRHLLSPCVRLPSYAECLRAPILGAGIGGSSSTGGGSNGWKTAHGVALPSPAGWPVSLSSRGNGDVGLFPSYGRPQPTGLIYPPPSSSSAPSDSHSGAVGGGGGGTKPLGGSVLIRHPAADDRFQAILPRSPSSSSSKGNESTAAYAASAAAAAAAASSVGLGGALHGVRSLLDSSNSSNSIGSAVVPRSLSDFDDSLSAAEFAAQLLCVPPSQLIAGPSAHRLLARSGVASHSFVDPSSFVPIPSPYAASLALDNSRNSKQQEQQQHAGSNVSKDAKQGLSHYLSSVSSFLPSPPPARYMEAPRVVFLLLSDQGLHAAGADYHQALVTEISPAIRAAAALERVRKRKAQQQRDAEEAERLAAAELASTTAPAVVVEQGGAVRVEEDAAALQQQRAQEKEDRQMEAQAAAMAADVMLRAVAAAVSEGAARAADEAPPVSTLPNPLTEASSTMINDGTALPSSFGLSTGAVMPPPLPQADLVATIRARSYWPSAAVSSVVRGTRRTVFDDMKKKRSELEPPASSPSVIPPPPLPPVSSTSSSTAGLKKRPIQHKVDSATRMAMSAVSFAANAAAAAASASASEAAPNVAQPAAAVDARLPSSNKGSLKASSAAAATVTVVPPVLPKNAAYLPPHSRARLLKKLGLMDDGLSPASATGAPSHVSPRGTEASTQAIGQAATDAAAGLVRGAAVMGVATTRASSQVLASSSMPQAATAGRGSSSSSSSFNRVVKLSSVSAGNVDDDDDGDDNPRYFNATTFTADTSGITNAFGGAADDDDDGDEGEEEDSGSHGNQSGARFDLGAEEQPAVVVSPSAHRRRQQAEQQAAASEEEDHAPPQPRSGAGIHPTRRFGGAGGSSSSPPSAVPASSPPPKDFWGSPAQQPQQQQQPVYHQHSYGTAPGGLDASFRSEGTALTAATDWTDPDAISAEIESIQREMAAARERLARSVAMGRDRPAVEGVF